MLPVDGDAEERQADHDQRDAEAIEKPSAVLPEAVIEGSVINPPSVLTVCLIFGMSAS